LVQVICSDKALEDCLAIQLVLPFSVSQLDNQVFLLELTHFLGSKTRQNKMRIKKMTMEMCLKKKSRQFMLKLIKSNLRKESQLQRVRILKYLM